MSSFVAKLFPVALGAYVLVKSQALFPQPMTSPTTTTTATTVTTAFTAPSLTSDLTHFLNNKVSVEATKFLDPQSPYAFASVYSVSSL
ncbi:hypothetical protein BJ741DRAFT_589503 [Chytriomyces cf. hyalinus JEL632]|nr:hypothetical protein BJ741DRAFT_589503 [Chytriomyces cf. hyalinus JEL632]